MRAAPAWATSGSSRGFDLPGRRGLLALAVAEVVREHAPERFLNAHLELFALRHDRAEDLRDPEPIAQALGRVGLPTSLVDRAEEGLGPLRAAHESMVGREVWGVPTLLGRSRAVFGQLLTNPTILNPTIG